MVDLEEHILIVGQIESLEWVLQKELCVDGEYRIKYEHEIKAYLEDLKKEQRLLKRAETLENDKDHYD